MRRSTGIAIAVALALTSESCIHRHKEWPPRNTHKVISFSTERRVAVAAFLHHVLVRFPEIKIACLSLENDEDAPYAYEPDSALLREIKVPQKLVPSRDCPPTYGGPGAYRMGETPPKPPPGYVNPWSVFIKDFEMNGKHQARAVVEVGQFGYRYVHSCYSTRISRHNWRVNCPYNAAVHAM